MQFQRCLFNDACSTSHNPHELSKPISDRSPPNLSVLDKQFVFEVFFVTDINIGTGTDSWRDNSLINRPSIGLLLHKRIQTQCAELFYLILNTPTD
jgi:hypothetical protein